MDKRTFDAAVRLLSDTALVTNWALGELRAFEVDPESPAGKAFLRDKRIEIAKKILLNQVSLSGAKKVVYK